MEMGRRLEVLAQRESAIGNMLELSRWPWNIANSSNTADKHFHLPVPLYLSIFGTLIPLGGLFMQQRGPRQRLSSARLSWTSGQYRTRQVSVVWWSSSCNVNPSHPWVTSIERHELMDYALYKLRVW